MPGGRRRPNGSAHQRSRQRRPPAARRRGRLSDCRAARRQDGDNAGVEHQMWRTPEGVAADDDVPGYVPIAAQKEYGAPRDDGAGAHTLLCACRCFPLARIGRRVAAGGVATSAVSTPIVVLAAGHPICHARPIRHSRPPAKRGGHRGAGTHRPPAIAAEAAIQGGRGKVRSLARKATLVSPFHVGRSPSRLASPCPRPLGRRSPRRHSPPWPRRWTRLPLPHLSPPLALPRPPPRSGPGLPRPRLSA